MNNRPYSSTNVHRMAAVLTLLTLAACAGQGGGPFPGSSVVLPNVRALPPITTVVPLRGVSDATLQSQAKMGMTVPFYTGKIQSPLDGKTYHYKIVGSDPTTSNTTTTITYVPIEVVVTFPDGTVLDPRHPACNDTTSVSDRFYKGPNFVKTPLTSNGVNVGKSQVIDAFQRAEFWTILKDPKYHTVLKAAGSPIVATYTAVDGTTKPGPICKDSSHRVGTIPYSDFSLIVNALAEQYAKPNQVALILTYNIYLSSPGFTAAGYHGAMEVSGGTQVYAWGSYPDNLTLEAGVEDVSIMTHEIGELFNDPFGNNQTPKWGHVGQVIGCQGNLEVGDPLTSHDFTLEYNGFSYHPQELAFFSWFYRTPSTGTGDKYSFEGSFSKTQGPCT